MFHKKRTLAVLSFVVLAAMVLASCSAQANAQTGGASGSFTGYGNVTQVNYTDTVESTGQIQPQHITSLSFSTTGTVAQSNVQVGQTVKAGDTLMTLDPTSVPANLLTAQTDLTNAQNALIQLTNPDLSTISGAEKTLSDAYTNYQQAQIALSNAIISNQSATDTSLYNNWLASKTALDSALNDLPLANSSIDVQAFYQAVRETSQLQSAVDTAEDNASIQPTDTVLAQKVTDLKNAVSDSQTKESNLQAGLSPDVVTLVNNLSDQLNAYDLASVDFIGQVVTATGNSNVNLASLLADLTTKQSSLLSEQSTLTDQQNKRASMNGTRCTDETIADYQAAYDRAVQRWDRSAHLINSQEYQALQSAAANLTWCSSYYSAADIATQDAAISSTQAQIQLLQAQIATDQAQINDSSNSVYGLAINLNTVWAAYQNATQTLSDAVTSLYELERSPNPNDLAAAQAKVQSAQAEMNSLILTAPYSGEVTNVGYLPGDSVSQSTPAVVLVDRSKLFVDLQIDESHVVKLNSGDTATIILEANPNLALTGKVSYINPVGASNQGVVYYDVQVMLDQTDPSILIGATADVTIQAGQPQTVLTVPVTAVGSDTTGEYVYVIASDGSSQQVSVVSGQILADNTVIVSGNLQVGDTVGLLSSTSTGTNSSGIRGGGGGIFGP
ncbi:MAG: efflux RND transporter periplasmic adaptor subunit [Anaerolineales bacterium]